MAFENDHVQQRNEAAAAEQQHVAVDLAEDCETLSPFSLSPYQPGGTPSSGGAFTPQTPAAASPTSSYVPVKLEDFVHAGQTSSLDKKQTPQQAEASNDSNIPMFLHRLSLVAHLATFGIIGVLIRYWLGELFDGIGHVTGTKSALFHDLPANMFGCFFMGWVGLALKDDIAQFSELLSLGLSTGLMGSITTFSSWMVKLVALIVDGNWLPGLVGFLIGTLLAFGSLVLGMHSATGFKWLIVHKLPLRCKMSPDHRGRRLWSLVFFVSATIILWTLFLALSVLEKRDLEMRRLWLACVLGPPGVWLRWWLSRHNNGGGFPTSSGYVLKWLPLGTLVANLLACLIGFVLSSTQLAVTDYGTALWCVAIQLGTLGCLSTVSTWVVEVYKLYNKRIIWRAYACIGISIGSAFLLGVTFYASVVWAKGYHMLS